MAMIELQPSPVLVDSCAHPTRVQTMIDLSLDPIIDDCYSTRGRYRHDDSSGQDQHPVRHHERSRHHLCPRHRHHLWSVLMCSRRACVRVCTDLSVAVSQGRQRDVHGLLVGYGGP